MRTIGGGEIHRGWREQAIASTAAAFGACDFSYIRNIADIYQRKDS
jgi:hypothetical protein